MLKQFICWLKTRHKDKLPNTALSIYQDRNNKIEVRIESRCRKCGFITSEVKRND